MAKLKYLGKTLTQMKSAAPTGLVEKLILSKLEATNLLHIKQGYKDENGKPVEPSVTEFLETEANGIKDTLVDFLTSDKLNWTVSELKASLEVEEIVSAGPLNFKGSVAAGIPTQGFSAGATTSPGIVTVTDKLIMRKDGAVHGSRLKANAHAYVGEKDPVPNSDTTDSENDFTKVKLYRDKIPSEIL